LRVVKRVLTCSGFSPENYQNLAATFTFLNHVTAMHLKQANKKHPKRWKIVKGDVANATYNL
jgi:hypothetical protein